MKHLITILWKVKLSLDRTGVSNHILTKHRIRPPAVSSVLYMQCSYKHTLFINDVLHINLTGFGVGSEKEQLYSCTYILLFKQCLEMTHK